MQLGSLKPLTVIVHHTVQLGIVFSALTLELTPVSVTDAISEMEGLTMTCHNDQEITVYRPLWQIGIGQDVQKYFNEVSACFVISKDSVS